MISMLRPVDARRSRSASRMIGCWTSSDVGDALDLRILDDQLAHERLVHGDVDVLVDGGGDEEAAVLAVVRRQVGAAAAEADAQGTAVMIIGVSRALAIFLRNLNFP